MRNLRRPSRCRASCWTRARIDGAGELRIFFRVALPLMVPGLLTVLLINVVTTWNNYFLPLLIFNVNTKYPLTVGLGLWSGRAVNSGDANLYPMLVMGGPGDDHPAHRAVPHPAALLAGAACSSAASRTSRAPGTREVTEMSAIELENLTKVYATGATAVDRLTPGRGRR